MASGEKPGSEAVILKEWFLDFQVWDFPFASSAVTCKLNLPTTGEIVKIISSHDSGWSGTYLDT